MHDSVIAWFTFWSVYWLTEGFFPYDERSQDIVPRSSVQRVVARNMFLSLPYGYILWDLMPDISSIMFESPILKLIICTIIMDGWFYFSHRMLHHPWFYKWHKQHHKFNIPYPLMAVYCSPVEALLCDVTAMGLGPMLLKMSGLELEIWMTFAALHSLMIHSTLSHGRDHNVHHGKNMGNFGLLSLFDRLFGTYY